MASTFEVMAKLSANTANFDAGMNKATGQMEKLTKSADRGTRKTGGFFKGLAKGVGGGLLALGVTAVAAAVGTLASGVSRLSDIEVASAKLTGLGNSTEQVSLIMENALGAVKGTYFGMAEAATVAATAVAAGVEPGAELAGYLKTVADTAYIAGTSMQDMGYILNQVTTTGRASNEELMQLAGRGIPIYTMLGEQFGHTEEAIRKMAAQGQISSVMLQEALNNKIGGAALKSGETVTGAMANVQAAFQRVGANIAGPVFSQFQSFFMDVIEAMGPLETRAKEMGVQIGEALEPIMSSLIDVFMPLIELAFDLITPLLELINALKPLFDIIKPLADTFGNLVKTILPPLVKAVGIVAEVFASLVAQVLPLIEMVLPTLANYLNNYVVPILDFLGKVLMGVVIPAFVAMIKVILERVMPIVNGLAQVFQDYVLPVLENFGNWVMNNLPKIQKMFERVFDGIANAITWVWENVLKPVFGWLAKLLGIDMTGIGASFKKGFDSIPAAIGSLDKTLTTAGFTVPTAFDAGTMIGEGLGEGIGKGIGSALAQSDPFADFIAGLEESMRKVTAKTNLEKMGLGVGFIEAILGASDWETVYGRLIAQSADAIDKIQKLYTSTEAGVAELEQAVVDAENALARLNTELADYVAKSEEFTKKLKVMFADANPFGALLDKRGEFEREVSDTFTNFYEKISEGMKDGLFDSSIAAELSLLTASYEQQLSTIAKRVDDINKSLEGLYVIRTAANAYQEGMNGILRATLPLNRVATLIGAFEAQVVTSFDAVNAKIADGLKIGLFSKQIAAELKSTASQTNSVLIAIARQRDKLAQSYTAYVARLNTSRDFRIATKDALMGVANITTIGKSARTMIRNLGKTVERTETFRDQLGTLQILGLNKEAYNQIVNSGLDVGTATAKAILRGGPAAVDEINNLFSKMELESSRLADDAEKFLFDGGEQTIQGYIDGIVSQDEALRVAAFNEAMAFNTTFQETVDTAEVNLNSTIAKLEAEKDNLVATATLLAQAFALEFQTIVNAAFATAQAQIAEAQAQAAQAIAAAKAASDAASAQAAAAAVIATSPVTTDGAISSNINTQPITGVVKTTSAITQALKDLITPAELIKTAAKVPSPGFNITPTANSSVKGLNTSSISSAAMKGKDQAIINHYYNTTVQAGIGTNGAKVGKDVTKVLAAYAKTSGKIGGTGIIAI